VTLDANGLVPPSAPTPALPAGRYVFRATYNGDSNHATSISAIEPLTINKGDSTTATAIMAAAGSPPLAGSPPTGPLGASVFDTATVTPIPAGPTPTGMVTYTLTGAGLANLAPPAGWTAVSPTTWTDTVTLDVFGRVPNSAATPALPAGRYGFRASYSGDSNYLGSNSAAEPLLINRGTSTTATTILDAATSLPPTGTAGESVFDTATVTGSPAAFTPTGTVTYTFTGPQLATLTPPAGWTATAPGSTTWTETVPLGANGLVPNSAPTGPLPAGNYTFLAVYFGDGNHIGSRAAREPLSVGQVSPILTTTPNETMVTLGGTIPPTLTDTATLSGGDNPTGTITFKLFQAGALVHTETVPVNGNGSYKTPTGFTLPTSGTAAGTYQWVASYSGDGNNFPADTDVDAQEEKVIVSPDDPALTTTPNPTTVTLGPNGAILTDTATLSGGFFPTGHISFELFFNGGSEPVFTEAVPVNGPGVYTTPTGFTLPSGGTATGIYQWKAVYSGDVNNTSASDIDPALEQVTVIPAEPPLPPMPPPPPPGPTPPPPGPTPPDAFDLVQVFPKGALATTIDTTSALAVPPGPSESLLIRGLLLPVVLLYGGDEQLASIVGTVFEDVNANGMRDANEPGLPRRTVVLELVGNGPVQTTITDNEGQYIFSGLWPDSYRVRVMLNEDEQKTTSDWSITLGPGERAVAPDIGITDRPGRNAPGKAPPDKAPPGKPPPDKAPPDEAPADEVAPDGGVDEFWRLFGVLGQAIVLLENERKSLPRMAPRRRARARRLPAWLTKVPCWPGGRR
jgi:hypothetical protein